MTILNRLLNKIDMGRNVATAAPSINTTNSRFIIDSEPAIEAKLLRLQNKKVLLTVRDVDGRMARSLLTTIIHVSGDYIFMNGFKEERYNSALLKLSMFNVSANFEDASVNFRIDGLIGKTVGSKFIIQARIPKTLGWIQRRNTRRVKVPINMPIKIQHKNHVDYFNVLDVSVDGLCYVASTEDERLLSKGSRHSDCALVLPDKNLQLDCFEVVNNTTLFSRSQERQVCRIGCQIQKVSHRLDTALQSLINQIDLGKR